MANIFNGIVIGSVLSSLLLVVCTVVKRTSEKSFYLIFLSVAALFYVFGYFLEIHAQSLEAVFYGVRVEYMGWPLIMPLTYLFVRDVFGKKRLPLSRIALLLILPFLVMLSVQFFPAIKLYYKDIEYISNSFIANCRIYPGPLYYVWIAYGYFLFVLVAVLTLGRMRTGTRGQRRQSLILLGAVSIPVLASLVYLLLYQLVRFDPTPIAVAVSLALMLFAIEYDNLLNVLPLARAQVIEDMQDALIICDSAFGYLDANRAAKSLFPLLQTITPGTNVDRIPHFQTEGSLWMEVEGEQRFYMITHTRILEGTRQSGICIVFHDNTEKEQLFRKHHYQATFDPLLHVYNRAPFFDLAHLALSSGHTYALLMIDIDHFKQVNDRYGHPCGDAVLQTIARIIMDHLDDPIVGRYGGEEFVALLTHRSAEAALQAADQLRQAIVKTPCYFEETMLHVTVSIGIAHSSAEAPLTLEQAVAQADAALYLAKNSGRNCVRLHGITG